MSDISPFYFTLTIHLMAILMVISAIQFIGVTCLMNHVILFLRPLKMKDWLLCWIKSSTLNRMNFASENTLPLFCPLSSLPLRWRERWVSDTSAFSYLAESSFKVAVSCSSEDFMFIFHKRITENMTWYHSIRHSTQSQAAADSYILSLFTYGNA